MYLLHGELTVFYFIIFSPLNIFLYIYIRTKKLPVFYIKNVRLQTITVFKYFSFVLEADVFCYIAFLKKRYNILKNRKINNKMSFCRAILWSSCFRIKDEKKIKNYIYRYNFFFRVCI